MLDILLLLIPHLPLLQLDEVIKLSLEKKIFDHRDGSIQKLGYRVLGKVVTERALKGQGNEVGKVAEWVMTEVGTSEDIHIGAVKVGPASCVPIPNQSIGPYEF